LTFREKFLEALSVGCPRRKCEPRCAAAPSLESCSPSDPPTHAFLCVSSMFMFIWYPPQNPRCMLSAKPFEFRFLSSTNKLLAGYSEVKQAKRVKQPTGGNPKNDRDNARWCPVGNACFVLRGAEEIITMLHGSARRFR
jgi:hypothetical protein